MRVAVIGTRKIDDSNQIFSLIEKNLPEGCSEIVSGGASGVDTIARSVSQNLHIHYTCFLPEYEKYGKLATFKRNQQIIAYSDMVIAFWDYISKGTQNTLLAAVKAGKPVKIIEI